MLSCTNRSALGIDYVMNKKERLETRQACVSHAMTLTGFNEADGQIDRWKIENSWGEENGEKGYFVMTQNGLKTIPMKP